MSLRDKHICWDCDYQYSKFPREFDAFYQVPGYASSTLNCVHHGESLQQYLGEDRIHHEYLEATKHFEYQEWCKQFCTRGSAVCGSVTVNIVRWECAILLKDMDIQYLYKQLENHDLP